MFIETLFTIAKIWNQSSFPSTHEWIKTMWYIYIYTMAKLSAGKKNKILSISAKWKELKYSNLSEISQTKTNTILSQIWKQKKKVNLKVK